MSNCFYCFKLKHGLTKNSPRRKYKFCPMCGKFLAQPEPLSKDQLREMIGTPVWYQGDVRQEWMIINSVNINICESWIERGAKFFARPPQST